MQKVFAVIRFDSRYEKLDEQIVIEKVCFDSEQAEKTIKELDKLYFDDGCIFFVKPASLIPKRRKTS